MKVHLTTILLICFEHVTKALAQGMPISPCPKIFQYRFDGNEWFGLIAVRNPDMRQALQIRVVLSMRGKPTTHYLGEIELLTRGQFINNAPVLYKVRFPKHHFPPKLLQISANNHVICFGSGDQSIFMTQIQLEHTRKLSFIPQKQASGLMAAESDIAAGKEMPQTPNKQIAPANHEFGSKLLPHIQFKKKPFHSPREICGLIDSGIDFQFQPKLKSAAAEAEAEAGDSQSPIFATQSDYDSDVDMDFEKDVELELEHVIMAGNATTATPSENLPSITRGSWPWLAAIYVNNLTSLDYQCGGTLVSSRAVISSAHCFHLYNQRYTANEVLVFLGRHNLKNWNEEGSLAAPVDNIYIHSDYNSQLSSYDADIAVIILKDEVRYNTFIRPVCLWSGSSKSEYIEGEHGLVVGWSLVRAQNSTAVASMVHGGGGGATADGSMPKVLNAPIVSNEVCFEANAHFRSLSSNRTFCAGVLLDPGLSGGQGKEMGKSEGGLYTGISGAGLMIYKNNRWMLRGTVSAALPAGTSGSGTGTTTCCRNQYIIYTDVAKFIDWITAFII